MLKPITVVTLAILCGAGWLPSPQPGEGSSPVASSGAEKPVLGSDEWAKGIRIHTKWDDAIKECRSTGKLLFIYNGWQREKV